MARRKRHSGYVAWRVVTPLAIATLWGVGFATIAHGEPLALGPVGESLFSALFALVAAGIVPIFSWGAHPFAYSAYGPLERTGFPAEEPLCVRGPMAARVGRLWLRGPFTTFSVFPSGLGVDAFGMRSFIPRDAFVSVEARTVGGWRVHHTCPEVRSPIRFSDADVFAVIEAWV